MQTNLTVVVGAQWGDEGKGKWVDQLAQDCDIVCRFQGGNNAGHTLYVDGKKHVLHLLPNGVFHPKTNIAICSGVVVDPLNLIKEIQGLAPQVEVSPERLWLSAKAHVITPWHIHSDVRQESQAVKPIGTTKRGIGPTYADRCFRHGLRMEAFCKPEKLKEWIEHYCEQDREFASHYKEHRQLWQEFEDSAQVLAPYVCSAEIRIREAVNAGKKVLCEGAQGVLLDMDHGTYPYVTSSSTLSAQAAVSIGMDPRKINGIYGIAKAYLTRVGEGAFPTELFDEDGKRMAELGHEYGATTNRLRRCGWFDCIAMRYASELNGFDGIYLNKLDILSHFSQIKVAIAYMHPRLGSLDFFPEDQEILKECTPIYKTMPGWLSDIPKQGSVGDLPEQAREFLSTIESYAHVKIHRVGTGPGQQDYLTS